MKNLKEKMISMRTVGTIALAAVLFATMATSQEAAVMTGWAGFYSQMKNFFYDGLGGPGMRGVGIVIVVCGILMAGISFVVHKVNPQTRMPGWIMCLVISVIGAILLCGVSVPLAIIEYLRNTILGWFGFSNDMPSGV